jgi:bifunctional enzyme CysN/CysC
VRGIKRWPEDPSPALAGQAVGLTFDDPVFIDRGDIVTHADRPPLAATSSFDGVFFWLSDAPPRVGETLAIKIARAEVAVTVVGIDETIDLGILDKVQPDESSKHSAFALRLRAARTVAAETGARCVLLRNGEVVGGGKLSTVEAASSRPDNVVPQGHLISSETRAHRNGYRGLVAWLTGLPGSGKSTIAMAVERELFARGYFVYVLDGDNVRSGLNRDLGFTREGRQENIRRVGEVAALFADAGAIVITGTISPHAADRATARAAAALGAFHEIYVRASVDTCATRDVKGHYAKARAGELPDFTGVSAPYEEPEHPDLVVDTNASTIEASVSSVVEYLIRAATAREALLSYSI